MKRRRTTKRISFHDLFSFESRRMFIELIFVVLLQFSTIRSAPSDETRTNDTLPILMPDAVPSYNDQYLCKSVKLDEDRPVFITGFNPSANSQDAHHMLLYGCEEIPTDKPIWDCSEMNSPVSGSSETYEKGPTCASGPTIIYAWALDAEKTELPKDVAFKIGSTTSVKFLVLQVHYASIQKFQNGAKDRSGFILEKSSTPTTKRAGVLLLGSGGRIRAKSEEVFQMVCPIEEEIEIHPFAYRTHTHRLGLTVSAYRVRGENEEQQWIEVGRQSPRLPQMFYPVTTNETLRQGDILAAMCLMKNDKSQTVRVGKTSNDEMCNFYLMYWVDGDKILVQNSCWSPGPPEFYFRQISDLNVDKIPGAAFQPISVSPKAKISHGDHGR